MRLVSWRMPGCSRLSRSSGCPARTICSSFSWPVSRLVSRRSSSRLSRVRFCASSIISTQVTCARHCLTRKRLSVSMSAAGVPRASSPKSRSTAASRSGPCRKVLNTSEVTMPSPPSAPSSRRRKVLLPVPISPVSSTNPARVRRQCAASTRSVSSRAVWNHAAASGVGGNGARSSPSVCRWRARAGFMARCCPVRPAHGRPAVSADGARTAAPAACGRRRHRRGGRRAGRC